MDTVLCVVRNLGRARELADVTLVSGDGEQVEAHGVIRSACSPLLRRLFLLHPQLSTACTVCSVMFENQCNLTGHMCWNHTRYGPHVLCVGPDHVLCVGS